ncbi:Lrp/AsnC family transcriptional regulator [Actinocorallia sp. API 0066]|uniref:Lrp/AsnC family transcriptional regulator n=1 Tax=Actinocorallia sp. API 0066 TaxID=2896846 RepID=UPI001E4D9A3A|nr:Lrp/AsnC family transcriptional regulator [Actinocorallia sp. API 0066]MCD0449969.1 Lrp/AsnC family transcriptional regulator [Actinocorallia sp. API 0066]
MTEEHTRLDQLDLWLLRALTEHPRAGHLELSRLTGTSRMTVQARLERLERAGVIRGYGPEVDLPAAGFPVLAFVTVQIAQGALEEVAEGLRAIPAVLEAHATTGGDDLHLRIAAASHADLQRALLEVNRVPSVVRSTSVIALTEVVPARTLPLLESVERPAPSRVPGFRVTPPR